MAHRMLASSDALVSVLTDRRLAAGLVLGVGLWAAPASAHVELLSPSARYTPNMQKDPPCGHPDNPPGDGTVTVYQAGETIMVEFEEFVDHPGHYRIALDPTGTDAFTSPSDFDDFYNSPEVLLDDIGDQGGGFYQIEVTLPDEPCDPCTLQLIQVMNDGAWGPGDSDLYFQCADIVIEPAAATSGNEGTGGGNDETGGGNESTGGGVTSGGTAVGTGAGPGGGASSDEGEGSGNGSSSASSGPADDEDGGGGCSCRAGEEPASAAPWLLVVLLAGGRHRRAREAA